MTDRRGSAPLRGLMMVIIGTLLTLGLAVAAIRPPWRLDPIEFDMPEAGGPLPSLPQQTGLGSPPPTTGMLPPEPGPDLSWIRWVILGLGIAVLAVIITVIVARLLAVRQLAVSQPDEEIEVLGEVAPDLPTLQQGAARAEERLLAIGNPTDAIIAAWLALEEAADASGVHRQPAQTPTEFTADVLGRTGVDAWPVQTLLSLYLRARFSAGPASAEDLETARRCVRDLADNWQSFAETGSRPS